MNKLLIYNKWIVLVATLVLLISSCKKEIDVNLRSAEPNIVIEGVVKLDSLAQVRITFTKDFSSTNEYDLVKDAVVEISDDKGAKEVLIPDSEGVYKTKAMRGVERTTYNLLVKYNGKEYTATSKMPPLVKMDSLSLRKIPLFDFPSPVIHFQDPSHYDNEYYRVVVYVNEKRLDMDQKIFSTEFVKGQYINVDILLFPKDNGDDPIAQGDNIMIEAQCVDKDTFTFFESLSRIENSLNNPTSNIKGGALGYFSAYSFSSKTIKATW